MKIAVRYQSRGGNTKAVAEALAQAAGVTAASIDTPLAEPVDLLFAGGGIYGGDIDHALEIFLERLEPELVKSAAAFTTAGGMVRPGKILAIVKGKGIPVKKETLTLKLWFRNHASLGGKGVITLKKKELRRIHEFAEKAINEG